MSEGQYSWLGMDSPMSMDLDPLPNEPTSKTDEISLEEPIPDPNDDEVTEAVPGTEAYSQTLAANMQSAQPKQFLTIRVSPENKHQFRIYFRGMMEFTSEMINRLCQFIDSRTEEDTIIFYLGCSFSNSTTYAIGAIISAIQFAKAKTHAIAAGSCGTPETLIWLTCQTREALPYCALTIGGLGYIEQLPMFKTYMDLFMTRAKELKLINDAEIEHLWKSKGDLMLTYQDILTRTKSTEGAN